MMLILILTLMLEDTPPTILKMTFTGADRELAQGAIERNDLFHREIQKRVWLIAVSDGTAEEWARRLTASLPGDAGKFEGSLASPEEVQKVRSGEIQLQR